MPWDGGPKITGNSRRNRALSSNLLTLGHRYLRALCQLAKAISFEGLLTHDEFRRSWSEGRLNVDVDRSMALQLTTSGYLPKRYFLATTFWGVICILLIIAGPILLWFYKWWAGALAWIIAFQMFQAIRRSACQHVIAHSYDDEQFYHVMAERSILRITPK